MHDYLWKKYFNAEYSTALNWMIKMIKELEINVCNWCISRLKIKQWRQRGPKEPGGSPLQYAAKLVQARSYQQQIKYKLMEPSVEKKNNRVNQQAIIYYVIDEWMKTQYKNKHECKWEPN